MIQSHNLVNMNATQEIKYKIFEYNIIERMKLSCTTGENLLLPCIRSIRFFYSSPVSFHRKDNVIFFDVYTM